MFHLVKMPIALGKRAVFFYILLMSITALPRLYSVSVGIVDPIPQNIEIPSVFHEKLTDTIDAEITSEFSFSLAKIHLSPSELDEIIKKQGKYEKIAGTDYLIVTIISGYIQKQDTNFYDSNIIENILTVDGEFLIITPGDGGIVERKKFEYNNSSRVSVEELENEAIDQIVLKFRKFFRELDKYADDILVTSGSGIFVTLNKGSLYGLKRGDFLKNEMKGYVKIIRTKADSSLGYIIFSDKSRNHKFYKTSKQDFEVRVAGGGGILADQYGSLGFYPEAAASVYIPVIPYLKFIVDSSFHFMNIDGQFVAPFIISTGIEGYFDIFFISLFQDITIGGQFSQNSSGSYEADSFLMKFSGGLSCRFTSEFKIFADAGYRYAVTDHFYKKYDVNISGPFVRGGIVLDF